MNKWDAVESMKLIDAERITHMAGATPFLEALLAAAERAGTHLPSLKVFICGGASVPPQLIRRAQQYFERAVVTRVYGSTEVPVRSEEHTSELQSLMRISYAVFCLTKKKTQNKTKT